MIMLSAARPGARPAPALHSAPVRLTPSRHHRKHEANARRKDPLYQYQLDYPGLEGVAICQRLAPEEFFSPQYISQRLSVSVSLIYNAVLSRVIMEVNKSQYDDLEDLDDFTKYYPPFKFKLFGFIPLPIPLPDASKFIQLPEVESRFENDADFGEQRLAGINSAVLCGINPDDPRAQVVAAVPGATATIEAAKMFVLDLTGRPVGDRPPVWVLPDEPMQCGEYQYEGKTYRKALPLPMAFFKWQDGSGGKRGQLMPVAIQLHEHGRIYTPADAHYDWLMAKIAVGIADFNHHEMVSHLGQAHFFTEAFPVATRRNFDDDHPLSYLLRAHTRFLLANNRLGRQTLIAKDGPVERLLAGTLEESVELCRLGVINTHFYADNFKNGIVKRKVDRERLPYYPWRDDGQRLWDAIWDFTTEYVAATYGSDKEVQADEQLQWFAKELADPAQGAVNGMKAKVDTQKELVEILTTFIFISGPGHTAVNFTQQPLGGYTPNMALAARHPYREISKRPASQPVTEKDLLKMLPNQRNNRDQSEIVYTLCAYQFDALGDYDKVFESLYALTTEELLADHPKGKGLMQAITNFQAALCQAEEDIRADNAANRNVPYDYMAPSTVLNSISI